MSIDGEIIKEYSNDGFTIIWKPKTCIHAALCVKQLPNVYRPKMKPWIEMGNATTEALKSQIDACPSGALTYKLNSIEKQKKMEAKTKIDVLTNGPLLVHGIMEVTNSNGEKEIKDKTTAFCRCGVSQNKPYCDGAHKKAEFKG